MVATWVGDIRHDKFAPKGSISVFRFNKKHDILDGIIAVVFDDWCMYSQSCVDHDSQFTHLVFCANLLLALLCKHLMGIKYFVRFCSHTNSLHVYFIEKNNIKCFTMMGRENLQ